MARKKVTAVILFVEIIQNGTFWWGRQCFLEGRCGLACFSLGRHMRALERSPSPAKEAGEQLSRVGGGGPGCPLYVHRRIPVPPSTPLRKQIVGPPVHRSTVHAARPSWTPAPSSRLRYRCCSLNGPSEKCCIGPKLEKTASPHRRRDRLLEDRSGTREFAGPSALS
jgi:hypothetical protein